MGGEELNERKKEQVEAQDTGGLSMFRTLDEPNIGFPESNLNS